MIRLISSVFVNSDGLFKKEQNLGLQWNINFINLVIEYCQVYHTFEALPGILQVWNTLRNSLITLKQQYNLSLLLAAF